MANFENRDNLRKYLIKNKIEVKIHYETPTTFTKTAKLIGYKR